MRAHNFKDLSGQTFGKQTVIQFVEIRINSSGERYGVWLTRCICGKVRECSTGTVKNGFSCGCYCRELSGLSRRLPDDKAAINLNVSRYIKSAQSRGIEWRLSISDVQGLMKQACHYCGIEPKQELKHRNWSRYRKPVLYNGIDRVDNTRGYEIDNVVACCKVCNRAKDVMTAQEFLLWATRIVEHQKTARITPPSL